MFAYLAHRALTLLPILLPPAASWGTMLNDGRKYMESAPHTVLFPGIAISLTVLGFNLLGDGLLDVLDPRLKNLQ